MLFRVCVFSLFLGAATGSGTHAVAGNIVEIPSDVSVSLAADPTTGLESGDTVTFTISVTNRGPEAIDRLTLSSSFFHDELDVFAGSVIVCEGPLLVGVADYADGGYDYWIGWDPVTPTDPGLVTLDVGETRTCQFNMPLTSAAPDVYRFSFRLADFLSDLDPSNNSASVELHREAGANATSVPTLSPFALSVLAVFLTGLALAAQRSIVGTRPAAIAPLRSSPVTPGPSIIRTGEMYS